MTSLPIPEITLGNNLHDMPLQRDDERGLHEAFRSFAAAAGSLERSYAGLRSEVMRLTQELAESNSGLARSLEQNRAMRAHLDQILEGLPCGVLVASEAGDLVRLNPEARRLIEMHDRGAARAEWKTLPELPASVQQLLASARASSSEQELEFTPAAGTPCWLAARHSDLPGNGREPQPNREIIFILRDTTAARRIEEAAQKLRREQALAEMSALLAHEVRNPLASLELFAGLLADADLDAECRDWIGRVQAGLRTLAATVNNVLHFHNLPELERSEVDLGQLLDWARSFLAPLAQQSRIVFSLQNQLHGVRFRADRHRLEQVLLNLVLNAVHAMPGGGWIELRGRVQRNQIALEVADTGPGISPEHVSGVFRPGFTTRAGSPGLGLAVCAKIVEQHGGTIGVTSRPGSGAVFSITFSAAGIGNRGKGVAA